MPTPEALHEENAASDSADSDLVKIAPLRPKGVLGHAPVQTFLNVAASG
jgi:hypothetical protein